MAKKVVAPLAVFEGRAVVVTKDGTAQAQVQSFSIDDGLTVTKYAQSGDEKKYPVYGGKEVTGSMEMMAGDLAGLAALLGYSGALVTTDPLTGAIISQVEVYLKAEQVEFYITKEFYDASENVAITEVVRGVTVEKIATAHGAEEADRVTISINAKEHLFVKGAYTPPA